MFISIISVFSYSVVSVAADVVIRFCMVMSNLLEAAAIKKESTITSNNNNSKHCSRHVLKSKENTLRHKCDRALRRKLKKYKLRHDGKEDQDVLDVSQTLITLLRIKSPKNQNQQNIYQNSIDNTNENRPKNYLFKMGRRKQGIKTSVTIETNTSVSNSSYDKNEESSPLCNDKEKQQTNAFKLMMDSRNKSIGNNSPGKEKNTEEFETVEIVEKKAIKAKRNLVLQKMAEAKGSLKKKELEEYQENCIKNKMEKRAERLKNLLVNNETKVLKTKTEPLKSNVESSSKMTHADVDNGKQNEMDKQKTLTMINIFNEPFKLKDSVSAGKKTNIKEDEEFLKKLSPSIKKKENMLCYFKKVEKESVSSPDIKNESGEINKHTAIKVKQSTKSKKKVKKKKLSLSKVNCNEKSKHDSELEEHNQLIEVVTVVDPLYACENKSDRRKRKRKDNIDEHITNNNENIINSHNNDNLRPKRHVKKPVKYSDDVVLFSSDEELHIFTPKKKKHVENKHSKSSSISSIDYVNNCQTNIIKSEEKEKKSKPAKEKKEKEISTQKKNIKLAPIFAVKPQIDPAVIEAKQKFLHSGVPDRLKKVIIEQKSKYSQLSVFLTVVHVQQKEDEASITLSNIDLNDNDSDNEFPMTTEELIFSHLVGIAERNKNTALIKGNIFKDDTPSVLQNIKEMYPKFPVFRTYRALKDKSRGVFKDYSHAELDNSIEVINGMIDINNKNPDKLNWTDKYKPMSTKEIIGNLETIKELRKWLVTWTENKLKSKSKAGIESDSSDFYQSDTDSKDSIKSTNNLLVITGPVGSGKTSCVYAVAAELAMKVIEVNASSKRTGKIMLQDLQEATQSHKVNRGKSSTESSQKSQEIKESSKNSFKKKGRPKKHEVKRQLKVTAVKSECIGQSQPISSQDNIRTEMSLILVDDADVVFEQDDGFCSAIVQLVQCSKRPVILITTSTSCPHLQRFLQSSKIVNMRPLLPRIFGTWLDVMCIADNGICVPGLGAKFLDYFQGDMRKTINYLQFYISSQKSQNFANEKESNNENSKCSLSADDENSSMSWADRDTAEVKCSSLHNLQDEVWKQFFYPELNLMVFRYPLNLDTLWWSIPSFLNISCEYGFKGRQNADKCDKSQSNPDEFNVIAKVMDAVSISDYFRHKQLETSKNITSQPWFSAESDSVSEDETLCNYNHNHEIIDEISHKLITGSIEEAQRILELESSAYLKFPSMAERRERDRIVSRHNNLTSYLNPSAVLDRKALALDFWPSCRSICRIEKAKTDNNSKRNNRFCHYLKSVNVLCKSDSFDRLGDSLASISSNSNNV